LQNLHSDTVIRTCIFTNNIASVTANELKTREAKLDMAVKEARADYEAGRAISESIDNHMKRVADEI